MADFFFFGDARNGGDLKLQRQKKIMVIFHPSNAMKEGEIKEKLKKIDPASQRLELIIGADKEKETLVFPLGIYSGKAQVQDGLTVLESVV